MRIEYDVTAFPNETGGYNLTAYTEGVLRRIVVGTSVFLNASGILLVEVCHRAPHVWFRVKILGPRPTSTTRPWTSRKSRILAFRYEA